MKRTLALVLCLTLVATMLCACGSKTEDATTEASTTTTESTTAEEAVSKSDDELSAMDKLTTEIQIAGINVSAESTPSTFEIKDFDASSIEANFEGVSGDDLEQAKQKQIDLYSDLANEFNAEGINVFIVAETGELAVDSTVLFGGDSAELTKDGKAFLEKFIKAYTKIVFNQKYDGFVQKTMVEGHIAPIEGVSYKQGLPLSEKRANNVLNYCLSVKTDVDNKKLKESFEAVGMSNKSPVKNEDGTNNLEKSRRVSFKFVLDPTK